MRLRGLLIGGIIGAAATVYLSRRKPGLVTWAANAASEVGSSVAKKSMSKIMSKSFTSKATALAPKHSDGTAEKSEAAWGQIESIVNSDPELKKEADKIKAESSAFAH
ncbi:gas vesicle protein [Paenibacillus castaneae]|uniref:hypothetical protein n=1 Tax=Paenibacillus castaneae TaxID=474957 RepID=UPI000C9C3689|nr:hypothetical protein [Paenibacillus castaneae]NIK77555.1 gas vesicle protein [Paenibacillus castaneae]